MSYGFDLSQKYTNRVFRPSVSSYASRVDERPEKLHKWLRREEIERIHKVFRNHPERKLNHKELRNALNSFNIAFTDDEFSRLFLKINQNKDYKCDWDEFVSHLIFGFQDDDPNSEKETLIQPISEPPIIKKSEHRTPVISISHLKNLEKTEDQSESKGMFLTASKEGLIRFWSSELDPIRSGVSESYFLKMPTWILAIQALSDVAIICTSSTERELRFHETMASNFSLRIVIRSLPFAVYCMAYRFDETGETLSKLILGDIGGNVRVLEFSPVLRGPFQSKPGTALVELFWSDILKGRYPSFRPREFLNIHSELIQKVYYSYKMNILLVAAEYRNTKKYRGRCPGIIAVDWKDSSQTVFRIPLGVTGFFLDEHNRILATGGPDTYLRIWDPYIPAKPSAMLAGHHGGIIFVFIQPEEKKVYSVDYLKIIKVWHLSEQNLLQTFSDLAQMVSKSETELSYYYDKYARQLLCGGRKVIALKCCPRIRMDLTDGNTHAAPVSVILYNKLFRNIVTCGLDSYIIVWDPWTGRRQIMIKNCHTQMIYGELTDIEITAACFDPLEQFLLTGARDGSLKVWNYNNAVCVRNMSITPGHEVTTVSWIVDRIFACGWDRHVTEFADVEGKEYSDPKKWFKFHGDDITCSDVKIGECLVTGTYSGEIIFWKLETGQPYRRYNVEKPNDFVELIYKKNDEKEENKSERVSQIRVSRLIRKSLSAQSRLFHLGFPDSDSDLNAYEAKASMNPVCQSVQAALFLQSRPMLKDHGSLFVALDSGMIQVYSHHQGGGFINEFNAVHKTGDCILAMATDKKNRYLFTGSAFGYVKVWLVQNYCIPREKHTHVCMPKLRLQFIFMHKERFVPRPKRIVRHQPEPMLLSSFKAHVRAITSLVYMHQPRIILSGSHDYSCRLWSLGGRYLGTLGTPLPWLRLSPLDPVDETLTYRMPPDIKKVASSTTLKVLTGTYVDCIKQFQESSKMEEKYDENQRQSDDVKAAIYGKPLRAPILGKHFKLPGKTTVVQPPILDTTLSYIPVYSHLQIHDAIPIERPPTPEALKKTKELEFMEFFDQAEPK